MPGEYFDEWQVGETIEHPLRRTLTETDNLLWSTMTHNPQPLHLEAEAGWLHVLLTIFGLLELATLTFWLLTR
jgi:acyl dehydratase